jgi:hypothetical protein
MTVMYRALGHYSAKQALGVVGKVAAIGVVFEENLTLQTVRADVVHGHSR